MGDYPPKIVYFKGVFSSTSRSFLQADLEQLCFGRRDLDPKVPMSSPKEHLEPETKQQNEKSVVFGDRNTSVSWFCNVLYGFYRFLDGCLYVFVGSVMSCSELLKVLDFEKKC